MMRINLALLIAVLISAMYLIHVQYESRRLFTELEKANALGHRLEVEQSRLQVERRAEATSLRVEMIARKRLMMRGAAPSITQYVRADGSAIPVPIAPVATASTRSSTKATLRGRQP